MKKTLLIIMVFLFAKMTFAQKEMYSKVKIYTDNKGIKELLKMGIPVDDGFVKENLYVITEISASDINKVKASNFKMDVLIEDVSKFYVERFQKSLKDYNANKTKAFGKYTTPDNFELGSMGGFYTYEEMLRELDSMEIKFPSIFKAKQAICDTNTHENRPIYWVKISDNADVDENEPEIMYTALHHAREPMSMQQLIFFMYYLLENYQTDPLVKYMVDNTELYFVPCVNPDGYKYNHSTDPNGGGMWRKNRFGTAGNQWGIDLNRNYGWYWGYDDVGSSNSQTAETYRGASAFSEAETRNMRYFCNQHQFKIAINNHTYSNLLIYPWGYEADLYTPDSATFVRMAQYMTSENHYKYGTGNQTVNYVTNGSSDDWMYGEQTTKNKIMAFTPEAGDQSDGFWPDANRIIDIAKSNMTQNIYAALFLQKFAKVIDKTENIIGDRNANFNFELECLSLNDTSNFSVSIKPINNSITVTGDDVNFIYMTMLDKQTSSIAFTINNSINSGDSFKFLVEVNNGSFTFTDTITKMYGNVSIALNDTCNTLDNWVSSDWEVTSSSYYSSPSCITDTKNSYYGSNSNTQIVSKNAISLDSCTMALLNFRANWDIEADYDYVQLSISTDNGSTWTPLAGKYTTLGAYNQTNAEDEPLYEGQQPQWVLEEISLNDYINQDVKFKFNLVSDGYMEEDGFYFDDFKIITLKNSTVNVHSIGNQIENIEVYPNPAKDFIQIKSNNFATGDVISINSIAGNTIKSIEVADNKSIQKIGVNELKSGIYFVTIKRNAQVVETKKLIVK